jgi:hypothetical protein
MGNITYQVLDSVSKINRQDRGWCVYDKQSGV